MRNKWRKIWETRGARGTIGERSGKPGELEKQGGEGSGKPRDLRNKWRKIWETEGSREQVEKDLGNQGS